MVTIKEVEEVISKSFLPPPRHVYISEKPVEVERGHERFWIMGAQKRGQDMIILTPYSTVENIIHEMSHNVGFGELGAQIIGKLGALRQNLLPCVFRRRVRYSLKEEDAAEKLGFREAGGHYILKEKTRTAFQVKHFVLEGY